MRLRLLDDLRETHKTCDMTTHSSVAQLAWQGRIPIQCDCLCDGESIGTVFWLAPRAAPLIAVAASISEHFGFEAAGKHVWFSTCDGVALPALPTGVLSDCLRRPLPWRLRAHFDSVASAYATSAHGEERLKSLLSNTLKEACFLASGSSAPVMTLPRARLEEVYEGYLSGDRERWWRGLPEELCGHSSQPIAVRLYRVDGSRGATWRDAVTCESHAVRDASVSLRAFLGAAPVDCVTIHGVRPPLDVPMSCLLPLAMPDCILHVVVALKS